MKRQILANAYGSAFPLKMEFDREILSKFVLSFLSFFFVFITGFLLGSIFPISLASVK